MYLNEQQLKTLSKGQKRLRALNHKLRNRILGHIYGSPKKITVTEIYNALGIEQSVCSQHLAVLRAEKFVTTHREGKNIYYAVNVLGIAKVLGTNETLCS